VPQPTGVPGQWKLRFDDEFNGTRLNRSKWAPCWFPDSYPAKSNSCGAMNDVTTYKSLVKVAHGVATLTLASPTRGALITTNPEGGANPGFEYTTGVVEARVRFAGNGANCLNWAGWWTTGQNWPMTGEHDIAEVRRGNMTVNYHSRSGTDEQAASPLGYWCGGYHIYTLDREVGHAYVYYDGTLVMDYATDDNEAPHYLVLNVGSGGVSSYRPDVKVDYVRAWSH
jgi:hypothetical protein